MTLFRAEVINAQRRRVFGSVTPPCVNHTTVQMCRRNGWLRRLTRFSGQGDWEMRALTIEELGFVSGGMDQSRRQPHGIPDSDSTEEFGAFGDKLRAFIKAFKDVYGQAPTEAQLTLAVGAGALAGAPAGPIGAVAGGVFGALGYLAS